MSKSNRLDSCWNKSEEYDNMRGFRARTYGHLTDIMTRNFSPRCEIQDASKKKVMPVDRNSNEFHSKNGVFGLIGIQRPL